MEAVKDFYENKARSDGEISKKLILISKIGTPTAFVIFSAIYWTAGILKYINGTSIFALISEKSDKI